MKQNNISELNINKKEVGEHKEVQTLKDIMMNNKKDDKVDSAVLNPPEPSDELIVHVANCVSLNVRVEPRVDSNRVKTIKAGTLLHVIETINDYFKVKMDDGTVGYVPIKFTK